MQRIALVLGTTLLLTACGDSNFNAFFATQKQKDAQDQLLVEAQLAYDEGDNDKALELTQKILKNNPYEEKTLILRSYAYLGRAGLDAFSLSKKMIEQTDKNKESGTTDSSATLSSLAAVLGIDKTQVGLLGSLNTDAGVDVYYPKSRTEARKAASFIMENVRLAVSSVCPVIQLDTSKDATIDPAHGCTLTPFEIQGRAMAHFAWALAHLSEAVAFFSVVLYDDGATDTAGKALGPNIQRVPAKLNPSDVTAFLGGLEALTGAINSIFPTQPAAAEDSMLNGMFSDLEFTSKAFSEMGGVPESVTKSIDDVIDNLRSQISKISTTTDSGATSEAAKQNAAVRNELTKTLAADLDKKIEAANLTPTETAKACLLFKSINSDPTKTPNSCK